MERGDHYDGHEHAIVKHAILGQYLKSLAYTIGWQDRITLNYVDAFAGPWVSDDRELSLDDDLGKTSPYIAIRELSSARDGLAKHGKVFAFRCMFIEREAARAQVLREALRRDFPDLETHVLTGCFEDSIGDVRTFAQTSASSCPRTFGFVFIDPKGWTGFPMEALVRLTEGERYIELLINFMLSFLRRFVSFDDPSNRRSILDLYGPTMTNEQLDAISELSGDERDEALVAAYRKALRETIGFEHTATAMILHPNRDDRHYDLVYTTRNVTGLRKFRNAERSALPAHKKAREQSHQRLTRERESAANQTSLFSMLGAEHDIFDSSSAVAYVTHQCERARDRMRVELERFLQERELCTYLDVETHLLPHSLTWDRDIKAHLKSLQEAGDVELDLAPGERVPRPETKIRWLRPATSG